MNVIKREIQRGMGSEERPVTAVLLKNDTVKNSPIFASGAYDPDNKKVDFARYYSHEYFQKEIDKIWRTQWLYAGRDEDIPNVGDRFPFDVGPLSFLIVRSAPNEIKA